MNKNRKLTHVHFSVMEREIEKSLRGAVWMDNRLYIEFATETGNQAYVSLFELDGGSIRTSHRCLAVDSGKSCWHLAAAHRLFEAVGAETIATTDIAVHPRNVSYPPPGGYDCTHLLMGREGKYSLLQPEGILKRRPEEAQKVVPRDETRESGSRFKLQDDDQWLLSLKLHPAILERVINFRQAKRRRLKKRPEALIRVPNLGGDDPRDASLARLLGRDDLESVKRVQYFGGKDRVEEALTPLLFSGNWHPVLLTGNASTGKTVLAYFLARILMMPVTVLSGTLDTNEEKLIGFRDIKPLEGGKFATTHVPGALLEAIRNGDMLIFNEINVALPEVLSILNDILDWQKRTYVTGVGEIRVADDFRMVATMNPGYVGTTELNLAFSSRFHHMEINYPTEEVFKKIITGEAGFEDSKKLEEAAAPLVKIYGRLKQRVESGELDQEVLSIRSFTRAALNLVIREGGDSRSIVFSCLASGVRDENSRYIIKDIIEAFSFD